ncbi:transcriptional regulator, IclR family [Collimonas sp. OK607]|nr:transcriptional regulator, IclR family [Collimonas sp. OK607]
MEQEIEAPETEIDVGLPTAIISLRILETLASTNEEYGITNLAQSLGMPKARVHRHLTALKNYGYVTQNPSTNRYSVGWRLYLLGQNLVKRFQVVSLSTKIREDLRDKVGQAVVISTYTEDEVIVLNVVLGKNPLEILLRPGANFSLNSAAQGKVVLAFGPESILKQTLDRTLLPDTSHTITDPDRLQAEIEQVRKQGWADAPEELFLGVNAIAAPIFMADGTLFGTLAVTGSIHYLPVQPATDTVSALLEAAAKISTILGYTPSSP